jgi:hypothetical protein
LEKDQPRKRWRGRAKGERKRPGEKEKKRKKGVEGVSRREGGRIVGSRQIRMRMEETWFDGMERA